jgi:hypothetical protein
VLSFGLVLQLHTSENGITVIDMAHKKVAIVSKAQGDGELACQVAGKLVMGICDCRQYKMCACVEILFRYRIEMNGSNLGDCC